ncbi:hypothetical protein GVN24_25050 [Rhizobium sp. CRIBSB]|nr:hypothetical protein [Rhizobium sp. CRIBSB]
MPDFLLLMHADTIHPEDAEGWLPYFEGLAALGALRGGSAIGQGVALRRDKTPAPAADHLTGFIRLEADDLAHAQRMLEGNPVFEAGGTVEIRQLPED